MSPWQNGYETLTEEDRNPIDSFEDVYPWPYAWNRIFRGAADSSVDILAGYWEFLDPWTYNNHYYFWEDAEPDRQGYVVDLYWKGEADERGHLPIGIGNDIATFIRSVFGNVIHGMIWNGRRWSQDQGWVEWSGTQGMCVTHIHVEFKSEGELETEG